MTNLQEGYLQLLQFHLNICIVSKTETSVNIFFNANSQ